MLHPRRLLAAVAAAALVPLVAVTVAPAARAAGSPPPADGGRYSRYADHVAWVDDRTPHTSHVDDGADLPLGLLPASRSADGRPHQRQVFAQFPLALSAGAVASRMTLDFSVTSAASCHPAPLQVWTTDAWTASPSWSRRPALRTLVATVTPDLASGGCRNRAFLTVDIATAVNAALAAGAHTLAIALVAAGNPPPATSQVTLSRSLLLDGTQQVAPAAPLLVNPAPGTNRGWVASPLSLLARATNPGNTPSTFEYQVEHHEPDGSWRVVLDTRGVSGELGGIDLPDGDHRWRARTTAGGVSGPWSARYRFGVDSRVPAAPVLTDASGAPLRSNAVFTVGAPITISDPDGLAVAYWIGQPGVPVLPRQGEDPCADSTDFVCPAQPGGPVTVSPTGLRTGLVPLGVDAWSRSGLASPEVDVSLSVVDPDPHALDAATTWDVDDAGTDPVAATPSGPALTVSPSLEPVDIATYAPTTNAPTTIHGLRLAPGTTAQTAAPVVDTAGRFSVVAVVAPDSSSPPAPQTLLSQRLADGGRLTLTLYHRTWSWCSTSTTDSSTCVFDSAGSDAVTAVAVQYDPASRSLGISTGGATAALSERLPGPLAPARGPLVVGGTFSGAVGHLVEAPAIVESGQVTGYPTGAAH